MTDVQDHVSLEADNVYKVWPAWIARNDGGATPMNVPIQNGKSGTSIIGAVMLMNQFGKKGVMRRNKM